MKEYDLTHDYPKMPDSFKNMVQNEVQQQCSAGRKKHALRPTKRIAVLACMLALLAGVTAFAAAKFQLFSSIGKANDEAPALIQNEINATEAVQSGSTNPNKFIKLPDTSPLLTIEEVLFDGTGIYIYALETENGAKYDLSADGIIVNGSDAPVYDSEKNEDGYYFYADTSDIEVSGECEVTLPLSVYEKDSVYGNPAELMEQSAAVAETGNRRYESQEIRFIANATTALNKVAPAQTISGDGFTVKLSQMTLAPAATSLKYTILFSGTDAKERANEFVETCINICVDNGKETLYSGENADFIQGGLSPVESEDGWAVNAEYKLRAIKTESDTITVTPYIYIENEKELKPKYAFTISF